MLYNLSDTFRRAAASIALASFFATIALAQVPSPTPAPQNIPSSNPLPPSGRTIEDLRAEIRGRLIRPELNRGQVGIKIVSLNSGNVVFEQNSEKYFMPASNMKNFTVAAALEKLTPDYRFVTSVFASSLPDASGTIKGDLRIYGRGDVSISTAFNALNASNVDPLTEKTDPDKIYFKGIDKLVDKIIAAGVKQVDGSIVGDDSYFKGYAIPEGWEWDDLQSYFGAEVSALPVNDNAVDLSVTPGPVGYSCSVKLSPYNPIYRIKNSCITTAAGSPRTLRVHKVLGQNLLEISGTLPIGNGGFKNSIAVTRPAELFAALVRQRLVERGVAVTG
ncbi:MAG: D-alanyl-D-alanine carboxypeptidase/D-alanyl-D-alanine-endopeptidase, partial [Acidobacteriota bacterium]